MAFALISKASSVVPVPRNADATNSRQHGILPLSLCVKKSEEGVAKRWQCRARITLVSQGTCSHCRLQPRKKQEVKRSVSNLNRASENCLEDAEKELLGGGAVDSLGSLLESVAVPEKTQACGFWLLRW